ncbi:beta-lactamase family protein [Gracilibacillus caseinilyticus]|uniref:Beta-lactamase family protein n=1 Tax=Gracilibacillus caseinilyticus TaxID=2932256 RepID=A0ABY4F3G0_9BACI|nr:serine hydrolase domain-containing protein [Gracilibacillus caseinilyticus]UOQ48986.1 beta-lactamase family protein [Gracilibacillus caseinilyticus]
MFLNGKSNHNFSPLLNHVYHTFNQVDCSGAATYIIQHDSVVLEEYIGKQSKLTNARLVQHDTQFHVASVRKSYIGFAVAYAVHSGYIQSIDDPVLKYLPELEVHTWGNTTIRHLLTHTHGLHQKEDKVFREHPAGDSWTYRQVGINALTEIVKRTTKLTISDILHKQVFHPLGFTESDWYADKHDKLVEVIVPRGQEEHWKISRDTAGGKPNMYVSARELAYWGYLHLMNGNVNGKQFVPEKMIQIATSVQSPIMRDGNMPQNGFLWFVKDLPAEKSEIGEKVPQGSFQILGYTGVTLLVIPSEDLVAVRMFNSFGSPEGYDYLSDVRSFGDTIMSCLKNNDSRIKVIRK